MGLDAYLETGEEYEIKYWRNHLNLHAWMANLVEQKHYAVDNSHERHGKLVPGKFQLCLEDLESLRAHIDAQSSEQWMRNISRQSDRADDLNVISHAIGLLKDGKTIWYYSCW
jgi:hypothetical protein